jgi:hypothetical protein
MMRKCIPTILLRITAVVLLGCNLGICAGEEPRETRGQFKQGLGSGETRGQFKQGLGSGRFRDKVCPR